MNKAKGIISVFAVAIVLAVSGCATAPKGAQVRTDPVSFSNPIEVPEEAKLIDKNDPKAYVKYCLALSACGRHEAAGDFFMEAAKRFRSQRNEFAIDAYAAAATEYFYAGKMENFRDAVLMLKKTADRYQTASFENKITQLIDLGNVMDGSIEPNEATTASLRKIYKQNR